MFQPLTIKTEWNYAARLVALPNSFSNLKIDGIMEFALTEEHQMIQEAARDIAQKDLAADIIERDKEGIYPSEHIKKLGEHGFMGMMVSPDYGGSGMDTISYVLAMEELSKIDPSTSVIMSVNNSLVCWGLETYGSEAQKQQYLTPLATGEKTGAFCLSEPEAGSDATQQKTSAEDKGDHYLLNGTKNWITNGGHADIYLVMAQSDPEKGAKGINAFIVEADQPGITIGKEEDKMGIRSSDTHSIMFDDVKVPKENLINKEGFGFKFAMKTLEGGRIGIAAQALGIASGAYELSLKYAQERKAFNKEIYKHQSIAFKLAEMATRVEAARNLTMKAAWLKDQHADYSTASSMAKLYASEAAMDIATEAVQVHGGYGYVREYHVERMMRDAKITQIYEGTSEVQRVVISRSILDQ